MLGLGHWLHDVPGAAWGSLKREGLAARTQWRSEVAEPTKRTFTG